MSEPGFVEHCRELLSSLGTVRARRLFGGHGFDVDGLTVALIVGDRLFLKTDPATRAAFEATGGAPFRYRRGEREVEVGYWSAPDDAMDSPQAMAPWARLALQAAVRARRPRRRAPR